MHTSLVTKSPSRYRWDIFCRIVDNYGDIGVCWRLAKQLANEHHLTVRLFVDLPEVAQQIISDLNTSDPKQWLSGVEVYIWHDDLYVNETADVVIEAFSCDLPERYIATIPLKINGMVDVKQSAMWLNLEYLSAEKWVGDFHAKPSTNPATGLVKYFFFPGFNRATGGLLRETDLIVRRDVFQADAVTQWQFLRQLGVYSISPVTIKISLFCYLHAPIISLLHVLSASNYPIVLFVPDSAILKTILQWSGVDGSSFEANKVFKKGNLSIHIVPFLTQDDYDKLLWLCDLNFVRGEDSWVRAIWAARPFIWQPYFQQESTHILKLNAFLDDYCQQLNVTVTQALRDLSNIWLSPASSVDTLASCWNNYVQQLEPYKTHAQIYTNQLARQADLASKLVDFCNQ